MSFQEFMANELARQMPLASKIVLELGTAGFEAARTLRGHGATVIVSNIYDAWRDHPNRDFVTALIDARNIGAVLPTGSVDAVFGINLLEHLHDLPRVLNSIASVLRAGGVALLHGHPIWTSARGHHALMPNGNSGSYKFVFHDDTNPVPLWAHLTHSPEELRTAMAGHPDSWIDTVLRWCFETDEINRASRRQILRNLHGGRLQVRELNEDAGETPDAETLERIRISKWWDIEEDYSIRQITAILEKPYD